MRNLLIALLVATLIAVPGLAAAEETPAEPEVAPQSVAECVVTADTAGTKPAGAATSIWGTISDCDSTAVSVQSLEAGAWVTFGAGQADASGFYAIALTRAAAVAGVYTYRALVRESDGSTHTSEPVTLTRTAWVSAFSAGTKQVSLGANAWGMVGGAPGATVWTEVQLATGWSRSQLTRVDAGGSYVLPLTYGANTAGTYLYRVAASTPSGTVYSEPFTLTRVAVVTASSAATKTIGVATNAWGRVAGAANSTVWTEVRLATGWSRSQVSRADSTGRYTLPLTYGSNTVGTYRYRVGAATPTGTVYSPEFTLTRTPAFRLDARCLVGRAFCASKDQRKMAWVVGGKVIEIVDVRFGRPEYPTRNGSWQIFWKNADHVSSIYNVAMPYSMFFSGGQAIHYSADFDRNGYVGASHGCINVGDLATAARLFNAARVGDKVIVYN